MCSAGDLLHAGSDQGGAFRESVGMGVGSSIASARVQGFYRCLISFLCFCASEKVYSFLELFAGRASFAHAMRQAGNFAAKFDLLYATQQRPGRRSNFMDLGSPSGFATLVCASMSICCWPSRFLVGAAFNPPGWQFSPASAGSWASSWHPLP